MDPKTNLAELRGIAAEVMRAFDAADPETGEWANSEDREYRLAELVQALDGWISRGGFLQWA